MFQLPDDRSDIDDDEVSLQMTVGRNASEEPASDADLTAFQVSVMAIEDKINDVAVRSIVTADSNYIFNWDEKRLFTGQRETFTGTPGPTFVVTNETRPIEVFYRMIDSDFLDFLCTETNRYAEKKIACLKADNKLLPYSRLQRWTPTDRDEMLSFLTLMILQGLYPLQNEESYFSFNGYGTMPYFSKIMSYNRYVLLKMALHFVDNDSMINPSKLTKIQPVTDYFNAKFSELYYPSQDIVIDEYLIKSHGRLNHSQKNSSRATQVGVKTYELCESASGYLWKFFVSPSKRKQMNGQTYDKHVTDNDDRRTDQCPISAFIVHSLVDPLLNRGHTLIMDNFYNCPLLARYLKQNKTDCYGTLRLNREFVPDSVKTLNKTDLQQGEVIASYCSDLSVMLWRDSNLVSMISTYHQPQIGKTKHNRLTYKPNIVLEYNKSMVGVDRKDQILSAQPVEHKTKWYKVLFLRLYNTAIFNCFVIYKTAHPSIDHRQFRAILGEDLLKIHRKIDLTSETRLIRTKTLCTLTARAVSNGPMVEHRHFPIRTGSKQTRCWLCAQRKVLSRTIWKCLQCDVNLCIEGCFMKFHV